MKKFATHLGMLLLTLLLIATVFDLAFTQVYLNSRPRTKTQYLMQLKDKHIDYIFLGSSRSRDNISPDLIKAETGKTALNLGIYACRPDDLYLQLKLLLNNGVTFDKIFIQLDYTYSDSLPSNIVGSEALPYIHTSAVVEKHVKENNPKFYSYYYIPFYRYIDNSYSIGFRNTFLTLFVKKDFNFDNGYEAQQKPFSDFKFPLPEKITATNPVVEKMRQSCAQKKLNVVFFNAPYCDNLSDYDYTEQLKRKVPELRDYSKAIKGNHYFTDCLHLNAEGSEMFTRLLIRDHMSAKTN